MLAAIFIFMKKSSEVIQLFSKLISVNAIVRTIIRFNEELLNAEYEKSYK
jgi:hypothetical protein